MGCECFQECDMTTYETGVSSALYPADFLVNEIVRELNITEEVIRWAYWRHNERENDRERKREKER